MKNFTSIFSTIVFASIAVAALYLGFQRFDLYLRNHAIDGCALTSRYIRTENNGSTSDVFEEPSQGVYQKCLELKNIN